MYKVEESSYDGERGICIKYNMVESPRGKCYSIIILTDDGEIMLGYEQGNYAGGLYKELSLEEFLNLIKKEKELSDAIFEDIEVLNKWICDHVNIPPQDIVLIVPYVDTPLKVVFENWEVNVEERD